MLFNTSIPLSKAFWNDSEIMVGWIPVDSIKSLLDSHAFKLIFFSCFLLILFFNFKLARLSYQNKFEDILEKCVLHE